MPMLVGSPEAVRLDDAGGGETRSSMITLFPSSRRATHRRKTASTAFISPEASQMSMPAAPSSGSHSNTQSPDKETRSPVIRFVMTELPPERSAKTKSRASQSVADDAWGAGTKGACVCCASAGSATERAGGPFANSPFSGAMSPERSCSSHVCLRHKMAKNG